MFGWSASSKSWLVPVCLVSSKSRLAPVSPELELQTLATICVFYMWILKDKLRSACFQLCISPVLWAPFWHGFPLLLTGGSPQDYLGRVFSGMPTILMPSVPLCTPLRTFYLFLGPFSVGFRWLLKERAVMTFFRTQRSAALSLFWVSLTDVNLYASTDNYFRDIIRRVNN